MIDFSEQMEASKFEYGASKCKTKEERIKFCKEYLEKQNEKDIVPDKPIYQWEKDPFEDWEILKVNVAIDDWLLWSINREADDAKRLEELTHHIHKKAYTQLMDEVVKKGYVTIEQTASPARSVTNYEYRMTVRRTK
jgi:hypothetical protein